MKPSRSRSEEQREGAFNSAATPDSLVRLTHLLAQLLVHLKLPALIASPQAFSM
jgi:hypothetical protein